ncbi:MAG: hypothetical protein HDT33_00125, partial [Clostridiales bacterium]|nr:hypothetical protein [Clostridiales bacterium]
MCLWAYVVALIVYQIGGVILGEVSFGIGTIVAAALVIGVIYMLVRKGYQGEEAWAAEAVHASSCWGGTIPMAELREAHLRYLLAIYELSRSNPDVGTQAVAKALDCAKASVTKMAANLMDRNLLVRERYGKIYLTDTGFLMAKDLLRCVEVI